MKGTISLSNPIMVDGNEVRELEYDDSQISVAAFLGANSAVVQNAKGITGYDSRFDYSLHLYLGFQAVLSVNKELELINLEKQVRGRDISKFLEVGQAFMIGAEGQESEDSEEQ